MRKVLSPGHASRRLNLSTSRLAQLERAGILPAMRDSAGRRFYDPDVIDAFAAERARERAAEALSRSE